MAEAGRTRRDATVGVVAGVALGAIAAGLGAVPALADDPEYPSWQDVQEAKADRSAAQAESDRVVGLLGDLQDAADRAGRTAAIAVERYHEAQAAEQAARDRADGLVRQAQQAASNARTSRMRAGLLAASLARGGADAPVRLLLDGGSADGLLQRLSTAAQLTEQSQEVYERAAADERVATATGDQARAATDVLETLTAKAQDAMGEAQRASTAASDAVETQQRHADRLTEQLASLRGTSVRLAAEYAAGRQARAAEQAAQAATTRTPAQASSGGAAAGAGSGSSGSSSAGGSATGSSGSGTTAAGAEAAASGGSSSSSTAPSSSGPALPDPVEPTTAPKPLAAPPAGRPNSAQAAAAVAFARDQIGDAYAFGGAGPSSWDCSGLTMQAYASVGLGIGGHSATAQYRLAAAQGRLAPIAQVQVGDLLFYSDGGGDMYHVAIYSGSGRMIEAPYPGRPVREVAVRSADLVGQVARPTAS